MTRYSGWLLVMWALTFSLGYSGGTSAQEPDQGFAGIQLSSVNVEIPGAVDPLVGNAQSFVIQGIFGFLILGIGYDKISLAGTLDVSGVKTDIDYESQGPHLAIGLRLPSSFSIGIKRQVNFSNKWEETVRVSGVESLQTGNFEYSSTVYFLQPAPGWELGLRRTDFTQAGSILAEGKSIYLLFSIPMRKFIEMIEIK